MIYRSPLPDVSTPNQTLTEFVLSGHEARADKAAIVDGPSGRTLTYGALFALVCPLGARRRAVRPMQDLVILGQVQLARAVDARDLADVQDCLRPSMAGRRLVCVR